MKKNIIIFHLNIEKKTNKNVNLNWLATLQPVLFFSFAFLFNFFFFSFVKKYHLQIIKFNGGREENFSQLNR